MTHELRKYKCEDCGHVQEVTHVIAEDGRVFVGSGANWCDECSGLPILLPDPDSDRARLERHRKLHNLGIAPHPEAVANAIKLEQLDAAIQHLKAILNVRMTANEMLAAEKAARDWLDSIGEES